VQAALPKFVLMQAAAIADYIRELYTHTEKVTELLKIAAGTKKGYESVHGCIDRHSGERVACSKREAPTCASHFLRPIVNLARRALHVEGWGGGSARQP
jgi:hypothetical protein